MRKYRLILALVFGLSLFLTGSAQTTKVLFLGNSYTGWNDLPNIFKELAIEAGDSVSVEGNIIGGYTLGIPGAGHLYNNTSTNMIGRGDWNYVILQEQSQMPTIPFYRDNYTFPAADSLNKIIQQHNTCAQTVFYMTWGRKYGGEQCIDTHCSPVFVDYFHMQDSLESAYMNMTLSNEAMCAPVGISWSNSIANGDPIELFDTDASHPSLAGSYLAACTFYASIFLKSPVGINYYAGLAPADAAYLQEIAETAVLTDPEQWNIFPQLPVFTSFTFELDGSLASFTNTSINTSSYAWNFGDPLSGTMNTSIEENPSHEYTFPGTYVVTLLAGDSCQFELAYDTIVIVETGLDPQADLAVKIFPNPATDIIYLDMDDGHNFNKYKLIGLDGTSYLSGDLKVINGKAQIGNLSVLSPGTYFLVLRDEDRSIVQKILISP